MLPRLAIKDLCDLAKEFLERRGARKRREQKLLILRRMRETQQLHPAALLFSEEYLSELTGISKEELADLLFDLEHEGMVLHFLGSYSLSERWSAPRSHRPF